MRIIEQLTESTFVVELDDGVLDTEAHIQIVHDYIGYSEQGSLQTKDSSVKLGERYRAYGNCKTRSYKKQRLFFPSRFFFKNHFKRFCIRRSCYSVFGNNSRN